MADTRELILEAATRLFKEKGMPETSLRDVAAESGISKGSLYYHFPSKDLLALEVFERMTEELFYALPTPSESASVSNTLFSLVSTMFNDEKLKSHFFYLLQEAIRDEQFRLEFQKAIQSWRQLWVGLLEQKGYTDPELWASLYVVLVGGLNLSWFIDPDSINLEDIKEPLHLLCDD